MVGRHGKILIEKGTVTRKSLETPGICSIKLLVKYLKELQVVVVYY